MRTSGSPSSSTARSGGDDTPVTEAVAMVKTYVRQNTVDELKPALRFLGYGIPGAVLTAIGGVLVLLGLLRLLEGRDGARFSRGWSFLPYVIVLVVCVAGVGLSFVLMRKPTLLGRKARRP